MKTKSIPKSESSLSNSSKSKTVFLQTLCVIIRCQGQEKLIRAVIDSGSQSTYVSENETEINLLIGADVLGKLLTGHSVELESGLTAVETKLGLGKLNIIERVPDLELNKRIYLAHRPVIKLDSQTTKIRPVFDASASEKGKPSLNECLLKGTNLIELIPDILDRFRMYPIGISADIEKAFLMLSVAPKDRDFLRFFPHLVKGGSCIGTAELCLVFLLALFC
ncbi:uncharacterized protein TNCV_3259491 [Trichonephila clavipes]|nr:uncharacterized protein TNCV_3259491 [Trichonephila clavipes]